MLPGFGLTMGFTLLYLSLLVLIPLAGIFIQSTTGGMAHFWASISGEFAIASYKLSVGASLAGAAINAVFGLIVAWVLVRYDFPGKRVMDALVDLPFALPTAVAGIALTAIYAPNGWLGKFFPVAYTPVGVALALTFIGLPFVVRTLQPILADLSRDTEEAAASLGANYRQIFGRVILPELTPGLLTGFALAFARALGEYGSVIFIAGNIPGKTEITPRLIVNKLEANDYAGAAAVAAVMLVFSFATLLAINLTQRWSSRFYGGGRG